RKDMNPAGAATVHVACRIDLHAVGRTCAFALGLRPNLAAAEGPIWIYLEDAKVLAGGVVNEQPATVEGKAKPIRTVKLIHKQRWASRSGADSIDPLKGEFLFALDAEEFHTAIRRVSETNAAVRRADDVVGAVEL